MITGASRGLGFELSRQYAESGWRVIATARSPKDDFRLQSLAEEHQLLTIETLDVSSYEDIDILSKKISGMPVDLIINNAGILGDVNKQKIGNLDFSESERIFLTNFLGPLKIAESFQSNLLLGEDKKLINISSIVGSIKLTNGNIYFYRVSKAALNMVMKNLAKDWLDYGLIVGLIHPGVIDTDMSAPFNIDKISVKESAHGVRLVIDNYSLNNSGQFIDYLGNPIPW